MVYTSSIPTEEIRDLSSMVGKMNVLKNLLFTKAGKAGSTDPILYAEEEFYVFERIDNINKTIPDVILSTGDEKEHYASIDAMGKEDELLGFHEVNGFPFYGVAIGDGYFDEGVYAIIVTDGTNLYNYVPLKGNSYNPSTMASFERKTRSIPCVDKDLVFEDIKTAFKIK